MADPGVLPSPCAQITAPLARHGQYPNRRMLPRSYPMRWRCSIRLWPISEHSKVSRARHRPFLLDRLPRQRYLANPTTRTPWGHKHTHQLHLLHNPNLSSISLQPLLWDGAPPLRARLKVTRRLDPFSSHKEAFPQRTAAFIHPLQSFTLRLFPLAFLRRLRVLVCPWAGRGSRREGPRHRHTANRRRLTHFTSRVYLRV